MVSKAKVIAIIAAEASGDLLGASLMRALKVEAKLQKSRLNFVGVGGDLMKKEGFNSLYPMENITAFGFFEVFKKLPIIIKYFFQLKNYLIKENPDMIITIDAPDFNHRLTKTLQKLEAIKVHYVAPSVWAWRSGRAKKIAQLYDHLLAFFPFEKSYFEIEGLKTHIVGHPLVEKKISEISSQSYRKKKLLLSDQKKKILLLLPGSRMSEITQHMPVMKKVVEGFFQAHPDFIFILPTTSSLKKTLELMLKDWVTPVRLELLGEQEKYALFRASDFSLAASGTVSMELALAKVPTIILYKMNALTGFLARLILKIRFVSILNILHDREIFPEYLQHLCTVENISLALEKLVSSQEDQNYQIKFMKNFEKKLGGASKVLPSNKAAKVIMKAFSSSGQIHKR